jgi:hypothetical protein
VDTHGIGVLLHQGDLASVDAAAGQRHHRQHPYRLRGLAGVTGHGPGQRTGRTRRKTGRNAIGKAQHDRRRGLDGATVSIGHPARAVREGNLTHGTQDRPGLGFGHPDNHACLAGRGVTTLPSPAVFPPAGTGMPAALTSTGLA